MTERGRRDCARTTHSFQIARSAVHWRNDTLTIDIDETAAPIPYPVRGRIIVRTSSFADQVFPLDDSHRHVWRPLAPRARIEAEFSSPLMTWSGHAYVDSNAGIEPLERAFQAWTWSRAHQPDQATVFYDTAPRNGEERHIALRFDESGRAHAIDCAPEHPLPTTSWRLQRTARADAAPTNIKTMEDAPFYARCSFSAPLNGAPAEHVHETLSLTRFASPIVRCMLPFRMPRLARS